jgi:hypothetical protein
MILSIASATALAVAPPRSPVPNIRRWRVILALSRILCR